MRPSRVSASGTANTLCKSTADRLSAVAQIPMFAASGLKVQYLKVWEKSSYKVDKWVRKVCKSGDYLIRT